MTAKTTTAGLSLVHAAFAKPPLHIPNEKGEPYKTELVEFRSPEKTIKWNFWHLPDDLRAPHNHPWDFEALVVHGGYTEVRYWLEHDVNEGAPTVRSETKTYRQGDTNVCPRHVFHIVTEILPGTVTRMVCGKASENNAWGYLDIKTGEFTLAEPDPNFLERLRNNNRFLIK